VAADAVILAADHFIILNVIVVSVKGTLVNAYLTLDTTGRVPL